MKAAEDSFSLASDIMKSDILKAKEIADKANIDAKAVLEKVKISTEVKNNIVNKIKEISGGQNGRK